MKLKRIVLGIGIILIGANSFAISGSTNKKSGGTSTKASAADCAPANGLEYLNLNGVNALIETGGSMWQDRPNGAPAYEVPKGSGSTSIYLAHCGWVDRMQMIN